MAVLQGEQLHTLSNEALRELQDSQASLLEGVERTLRAREELA